MVLMFRKLCCASYVTLLVYHLQAGKHSAKKKVGLTKNSSVMSSALRSSEIVSGRTGSKGVRLPSAGDGWSSSNIRWTWSVVAGGSQAELPVALSIWTSNVSLPSLETDLLSLSLIWSVSLVVGWWVEILLIWSKYQQYELLYFIYIRVRVLGNQFKRSQLYGVLAMWPTHPPWEACNRQCTPRIKNDGSIQVIFNFIY